MNANEVIESYINDVAVLLPRKQRNDVAFELRALLGEELQGRAEAAGRAADAPMALELLQGFGRPRDMAARYRSPLTIIDPADGRSFLRAASIGMALIWAAGLLELLQRPADAAGGLLGALAQWWTGAVVASLWWPGLLVVGYGLACWIRQRRPQAPEWVPRKSDRIYGGRVALVMAIFGMAAGIFLLVHPHWILDTAFGGRAAPAAYQALTYTDGFLRFQAPCLLLLLLLNIPLFVAVLLKGHWSTGLRGLQIGLSVIMCAMLAWIVFDGPVMMTARSDQTAKSLVMLIVVITLVDMGIKLYRRVSPAPR